jgi:hypothetical protein
MQATAKEFKTILATKSEDWSQLITDYLNNIHHSEDEARTERMVARARSYTLIDGILYKKSCSPTVAQMYNSRRRQKAPPRYPFVDMRLSHWSKGTVCEGNQTGILLAHTHQRCRENLLRHVSMPKHIPTLVKAFSCSTTHPTHLATAKMGYGPYRTTSTFAGGTNLQ